MKKNILFIILTLFLLPNIVFAGDCSSTVISGGASSSGPGTPGSGGCSDNVCVSMYNMNYVGIRFQIYKYDGSGNKNGIQIVGSGVDVWATKSLNSKYHHFSDPRNNNLQVKASCSNNKYGSNGWGKNISSIYNQSASTYLSQTNYRVFHDSSLKNSYKRGKINNFVLQLNSKGNSTGGWLHTNFFKKLSTEEGRADVMSLFKLTQAQMDDLMAKPEDYYVSAEMMYRFLVSNGGGRYKRSYSGQDGHYYLGTVSEAGYLHGNKEAYNALLSSGGNVGKLVSKNIGGSYLIKQVSKITSGTVYYNDNTAKDGYPNAYAACNSAYGLAIYHVSSVCEDCSSPEYQKPTYEQCEPVYLNTCKPYNGSIMTKTEGCDSAESTSEKEVKLSSKSCYHDEKKYTTILKPINSNKAWDYKAELDGTLKYYRIHCYEDLVLSDLPKKKTVFISESGTGSLYIGYKLQYKKVCDLEYRNKTNNGWGKYNNSLLSKHITDYQTYLNEINAAIASPNNSTTIRNKLITLKGQVETAINEVKAVKAEAEARFDLYKNKDYKDDVNITSTAEAVLVNKKADKKSSTITLVPVHCMSKNENSEKYCDLMSNTWYETGDSERIVCDNSNGEQNSITTVGVSNKEIKTEYEKTIYYGLQPSYILTQNGKTRIYHDENECKNAVSTEGGYCKKVENAWVVDPIDKSVSLEKYNQEIGTNGLNLNVTGWGACSQFTYKLTCDYDYESSRECTKNCIKKYVNDEGEITNQAAYNECFRRNCSCDAYCGSDVACRARYCPEECEGCGWSERGTCDDCQANCDAQFSGSNLVNIQKNIECKTNNCCNANCDGQAGCLYNCCINDCNTKAAKNVIKTPAELAQCKRMCNCPNGNCISYIYRTINQSRPFPNGTNANSREPGANWQGKVGYITKGNENNTIYYDRTNGMNDDYEYSFEITSDQLEKIRSKYDSSTKYSSYYKSKKVTNKNNDKVYCSSIIHEELGKMGINIGVNRVTNKVGSGCK